MGERQRNEVKEGEGEGEKRRKRGGSRREKRRAYPLSTPRNATLLPAVALVAAELGVVETVSLLERLGQTPAGVLFALADLARVDTLGEVGEVYVVDAGGTAFFSGGIGGRGQDGGGAEGEELDHGGELHVGCLR